MAPEQVEHPLQVDHRADIYSLGVVLYQMLTGDLPAKRIEPPSRKVRLDVRLGEVVLRALEKEPERRYQQVSQVKSAVEAISQSPSPAAGRPQPADWRMWSPCQPHLVREICANMTEAEKREAVIRTALFSIWNAATFFGLLFAIQYMPKPVGWFIVPLIFLVGAVGFPVWGRIQREFLCTTAWARQQALQPDQLRRLGGIAAVGLRGGGVIVRWPGVLLSFVLGFVLILALAELGAICGSTLLFDQIESWTVGIAFVFAVLLTAVVVRRRRATLLKQSTNLDGLGRIGVLPPESPSRPPRSGTAWKVAMIVVAALILLPTACLLTLYFSAESTEGQGYRATATIQIHSPAGGPFPQPADARPSRYNNFVATQIAVIRSPLLAERVLDLPQVRETKWYREQTGSRVDALQKILTISRRPNIDEIDVHVAGIAPSEASEIVHAIASEYQRCSEENCKAGNATPPAAAGPGTRQASTRQSHGE